VREGDEDRVEVAVCVVGIGSQPEEEAEHEAREDMEDDCRDAEDEGVAADGCIFVLGHLVARILFYIC
jgi:hypothetical protein